MSAQFVELSSIQRRMWFVDQVQPGDVSYNMPVVLRVRGTLDESSLQSALDAVVARHGSLRTRFLVRDGDPVQEVLPDARVPVDVVDLRGRPDAGELAHAYVSGETQRPFDLSAAPLMRCALVRTGEAEQLVVFTVHHIVFDGWSAGVFFDDLSRALEGTAPDTPVAQFTEMVAWERAALDSGEQDETVAWWKEQLAGAPTVLELVTDRARPAVQAHRGATRRFTVPADVVSGLESLGRSAGATMFMTLLSAFGLVLSRHAGQDEVLVGAPVAFRPRSEFERSVGCFLNTVPMRVDTAGAPTFSELLARVKEMSLAAYDHQQAPFERLVAALSPEHDLSRNPLVQVLLNFDGEPQPPVFPGCTVEHVPNETVSAKFDLTLYVKSSEGRLLLDLVYDADLFTDTRIGWLLEQTGELLSQVSRNPHRPVGGYPLLSRESSAKLPDPYEPLTPHWPGSLLDRLAKVVDTDPDRIAMSAADGDWTYRQLDRAANQLARRLRAAGVQRGDLVGILISRDPSTQVAMLAAMKCAAPFVIMDSTMPAARLAQCLEVSTPKALVITRGCTDLADEVSEVAAVSAEVIRMDAGADWTSLPGESITTGLGPADTIYAVFTSGSTGTPKCVLTRHDAVMHFLDWYETSQQLCSEDRFAVLAGLGYEVLMRDLLTPMWVGAMSVFPEHDRLDFPATSRWLGESAASVVHLTPPYANELAAAMPPGGKLPHMRLVGINGDVLRRSTAVAWAAMAPDSILINIYGATETPQVISALSLRDPDSPDGILPFSSKSPIGPGITGIQILCVNPAGELCAEGEIGELVVRTPYLASYLRGEAGGFTTSPWTGDPEDRIYRTGDRVRYLGEGCAEFVGRVDHQIKLRGHRIEPGDIEGVLVGHEGVGQALVLVREDRPGDRRLVAYVTAVPGAEPPSPAALRKRTSAALPKQMVPSAFIVLPGFPLNHNGKVDRAALPAPSGETECDEGSRPPATDAEREMARLWEDVLAVTGIGVEDDFFALGGHSLLLTRLLSRVAESFGVRLSMREVFQDPTVSGFLRQLADGVREPAVAEPPMAASTADGDGLHGLSLVQRRLWFVDQVQPGDVSYNMSAVLRVRGTLDASCLQSALDVVVARHGALRTRFPVRDGDPVQEVLPDARVLVKTVDLRERPDAGQLGQAYAAAETRRPFDLSAAPLMRCVLVRTGEAEQLVVFTVHHIVFDGWSAGVFLEDLSLALEGTAPDTPVAQFTDLVSWERTALDSGEQDRLVAWWKETLAGAPTVLELPTDRVRPAVQTHRGARTQFTVPAEVVSGLETLGRAAGTTMFMTLLSAFGLVLSRHAGQDEVLVGTPVAFRPRSEFEHSVGCFLNTVLMKVDTAGAPTFTELLARVKEMSLAAFDHQQAPFERLVAELAPDHDLSRNPLYQVLFALQNVPTVPLRVPGQEVEALLSTEARAQCDISLRFTQGEHGLVGVIDYDLDLFDEATMVRLIAHLGHVLAQVAGDPGVPLRRLTLTGPAERELLLERWNDTAVPHPLERTLTEFIVEQARRTPLAPAVRFEDEELTYGELDRRANWLAHRLRELGVGPDVVVGVHLDRSVELMVALLAVLKAGGAYLPLEPGHPLERLRTMVRASAVPVVLTGRASVGTFAADGCAEIVVGEETDEAAPPLSAHSGNLAYVIYTSGSTGTPKGVQIPHRGIVNRLLWMQDEYALAPGDRVLHKTPISFDVSVWELFWPLMTGSCLVLAAPRRHREPQYLAELMAATGVTVCHFVPVMLRAFLETPEAARLHALRLIVCSGEELPTEVAQLCRRTLDARLENLYGPTEASVDVTSWTCEPDGQAPRVPIGTPIANTRTYVLDEGLAPVPVGVAGELYLGGEGLARGYHGRPALTAERFVAAPFGPPGTRLYRTGDRARWLPGGRLEFLGRLDHQVKVRGFRIELGEIEQVLARHDAVEQALALVREDRPGDRRLVAYAVVRPGTPEPPTAELLALAALHLPKYMVPSSVVLLDAFPVTSSGKVDRKALPAPAAERETPSRAPATEAERILAALWEDVLGTGGIGADADFFELGGDSMHAIAVVGRARRSGFSFTVEEMFRTPTVAALAVHHGPDVPAPTNNTPLPDALGEFFLMSEEDRARLYEA
ncbi:amino acid adenylation domain-containing protein [Streptomyces sp. NBC_00536]|uniref:amino acid adenylation domain-containing protein n=1 Tax=Streptomyces sp. NBC_00536 TaxID=2975769 RepID=UPI002E80BA05|nr:amino acid adenylation domain-containing protein [Streptomyces sp. NBC_00536]WUC79613.1 amino acid adenylation domain-containing protein [Streptomyces sp. NBC_00536]